MSDFETNKYSFLEDPQWQSFLKKNQGRSVGDILFSLKNTAIDRKLLGQQIVGLQIINKKVPSWTKTTGLVFPPKINLEQSSSELTAKYKANIVKGKSFIDLTGGIGVDSFFLAKSFSFGIHCEISKELQYIAKRNLNQLQSPIKSYHTDGFKFLRNTKDTFDLIYLDPSRRDSNNNKVIKLEDYEPNILDNLNLILSKGKRILLKTSPLLEIKTSVTKLPYLNEIHIVGVNNECKELLFLFGQKSTQKIDLHCVDLSKDNYFSFDYQEEAQKSEQSLPLSYLYEPNACILKAGAFNTIGNRFNIKKLHTNTHLYTSNALLNHFPGRIFKISNVLQLDKKQISNVIRSQKANITKRNFPISVNEIRKKTGIQEGGNDYLFATTLMNGELRVLICEKLK